MHKARLSARVIDLIINRIADETYSPGTKIVLKEIAAKLKISLSPVRDAIEQLDQDGWLERIPQSGTYIRQITLTDIEEIYELRGMLEAEAMKVAVERITPQGLAGLRNTVKALRKAATANSIKDYEESDTQFHKQIVEAAANKSLTKVHGSVLRKTRSFFIALKATSHGQQGIRDLEDSAVSHERILIALSSGQAQPAEQLIRNHIDVACEWNKAMAKIRWLSGI